MKDWTIHKADTKLNFGKYRGYTIEEVAKTDAQYLLWCVENIPEFLMEEILLKEYSNKYPQIFQEELPFGIYINHTVNIFPFNKDRSEFLKKKWKCYEEENKLIDDDFDNNLDYDIEYDYDDYLFNGFFEGDVDLYNEYMG
jgi:uncharacterized protein (DUF3820 family)